MSRFRTAFHLLKEGKLLDYFYICMDNFCAKKKTNLIQRQENLLLKMLRYANAHCDYYRNLNNTIETADDIQKYPLLTKDIIREKYEEITSDNKSHMVYHVSHTGGSTGEPLEFLNSASFDGYFQKKLWQQNGYRTGDIILAMDGSTINESLQKKDIFWFQCSNQNSPYGGYVMSSLYLTDSNIDKYCNYIFALKPDFIRGYPSFVYSIAKYITDHNMLIDFRVKAVELTSESAFPYQLETIKNAFKTRIIMQYGHTECCAFGYTFDQSMKYRIEPLYGYVEILKEDGSHAQIGETGEIVVTSLHNRVMPLIRYKTGDLAVFGGKDDKGIILDQILGRTQDYIVSRKNTKVLLTALIFAQHFDAMGHIRQWQIEQNSPGRVQISVVKAATYNESDETEILELFDRLGDVTAEIIYVDDIKKTARGKSKMLIQHLDINKE